jgi:multicomponent Na+:H+ antiporter subunit A
MAAHITHSGARTERSRVLLRQSYGWLIALALAALVLIYAGRLEQLASGSAWSSRLRWAPTIGLELSFYVDGLSALFALLVCGIGAVVFAYSGGYLAGHPQQGRFYLFLAMFTLTLQT